MLVQHVNGTSKEGGEICRYFKILFQDDDVRGIGSIKGVSEHEDVVVGKAVEEDVGGGWRWSVEG